MKIKVSQSGFSLLEMILAMSITIGLTAVVFNFLKQGQETASVESGKSDLNQNFRAAMDLISRDIQAAGAGIPRFLGPVLGKDGGTDVNGLPVKDANGNNLPDSIMVVYGNSAAAPARVNSVIASSSTTINAVNDGPAIGFTSGSSYILFTPYTPGSSAGSGNITDFAEFEIFRLDTATYNSTTGIWSLVPAPTGAGNFNPSNWTNYAHTLEFPTYGNLMVTPLDETIQYTVDKDAKTLQRNRSGSGWVDVARGITDIQIQYRMEKLDNTTTPVTYPKFIVDEPGKAIDNNRALIRGIIITLTAKTQMGMDIDKQGQRTVSQTFEVTPRNLALTGFVPNR